MIPEYNFPSHGMVLAAGLGTRIRAANKDLPKPLITVLGKPLIEYSLEYLVSAGIKSIVINTYYLGDLLVQYIYEYMKETGPIIDIQLSHEENLMETGGGVVQALPHFGDKPFFILNSDTILRDKSVSALSALFDVWNDEKMDALLLICTPLQSIGHKSKKGDFTINDSNQITRVQNNQRGYNFCGVQLVHPRLFENAPKGPHSLNHYYDKAKSVGRLFGVLYDGWWYHVGTHEALLEVEHCLVKKGGL